jgi:hypothetical protein
MSSVMLGSPGRRSVGAGFQHIGQFIERADIGISAPQAQHTIEDDATAPGVGSAISQTSGHGQASLRNNRAALEGELRLIDRNGVSPIEIAPAIVEDEAIAVAPHPARHAGSVTPGSQIHT